MASPFRIFRKYLKPLLVVFGVMLMFVFVVGDALMQYAGQGGPDREDGRGPRPGDVAVRWDGGKLTNAQLSQLVVQRQIVSGFLRDVEYLGILAARDAGIEPPPLRVEALELPVSPQQNVEQHVVQTRIFVDAARAAGMNISDQQLLHYLAELGRGYVSMDQVRAILARRPVAGHRASADYVLDALREELLARNYLSTYTFAFNTVLPHQRWQDWLRVNDRVVVEAAAIPVETFILDVPEPTDAELTAFYDEYKDREPQPERRYNTELPSPLPGFAVSRKVELQFLRADYEQFLAKLEDAVTDEEIEEFYEENKDPHFVRADTGLLDSEAADDGEAAAGVDRPVEAATDGDTTAPRAEETPESDDATSAEDSQADAPPTEDQSSHQRPSEKGLFRLVAFAQEVVSDDTGADDTEADGGEVDESTATAPEADAEEEVDTPRGSTVADEATEPVQYQSLEEVSDEIRRTIAGLKASEQLGELMGNLERQLYDKYIAYFNASLDADAVGQEPPPPPPELADLSNLAREHGLDYDKTGPVSVLQLRDLPIGMSRKPDDESRVPLVLVAFSRELELYQPLVTFDLDNNRYLVMKTSDTPGRVPTLDEIRDEVVRAWKMQKAADLALAHAKEQAAKAQAVGTTLEDYFANDQRVQITRTDPFAFLTIGSVSRQTQQVDSFRLSEPDGIVAAGDAFMDAVFNLGDGDVGAVLNHDHSIAYVVRVVEHLDASAELRQDFLSEADYWYGLRAMTGGHTQLAVRVLIQDTMDSLSLKWERPPDQQLLAEDE